LERQDSEETIVTEPPPTPKISVTHADFAIGDEPLVEGRQVRKTL
jgi:hypothetical protein